MGNRFSVVRSDNYIQEILHAAEKTDVLRDEVYVQLIKQLTNNNNIKSLLKGYRLMSILCKHCPPSHALDKYIKQILHIYLPRALPSPLLHYPAVGGVEGDFSLQVRQQKQEPYAIELRNICYETLRALDNIRNHEEDGGKREQQQQHGQRRKERKSIFDFQVGKYSFIEFICLILLSSCFGFICSLEYNK